MPQVDHPLDEVFHPRSVAVVGATPRSPRQGIGAYMAAMAAMVALGYQDSHALYPGNRSAEPVDGLPAYASLADCPGPIDHVISQVPAQAVPALVEECIAAKVRSVHFFTAGFGETGDAAQAAIEQKFVARLTGAGIRVVGPNCLGMYVPDEKVTFMPGFPAESGNVLVLSQSGSNAAGIVRGLVPRGVRFSKVISYGNGSDVAAAELLDYALADPQTEVVAAYLEGMAEGRAFFDALRRCARSKPVLLLKGGAYPDGARAANSHTGALAGSIEVFDAMCRQTGALRARSMDELHDLIAAVGTRLPHVAGPSVGLAGGPGGFAVLAADALGEAGLRVPELSPATQEALHEIVPVAGASARNPIDAQLSDEMWRRVYSLLAIVPNIDVVFGTSLGFSAVGPGAPPANEGDLEGRASVAADALGALQRDTGVPFVGIQRNVLNLGQGDGGFVERLHEQGVAVFTSVERAARVTSALLEWRKQRAGLPELFAAGIRA